MAAGDFTLQLDFGRNAFTSDGERIIEFAVCAGSSTGACTTLSRRQPIANAPDSIKSRLVRAISHFEIGSSRILGNTGSDNLSTGRLARRDKATKVFDSSVGFRAGGANADGSSNSFFGERSGLNSRG